MELGLMTTSTFPLGDPGMSLLVSAWRLFAQVLCEAKADFVSSCVGQEHHGGNSIAVCEMPKN
jgi:hypothetical protein